MAEESTRRPRRYSLEVVVGSLLLGVIVLAAVVAPLTLGSQAHDLTSNANQGSSSAHWLGTDGFGRDLLARSLVAARLTLLMTGAAAALSVVGGVAIGVGIWLAPRLVREGSLRLLEAVVSYPGLLVALILAAILGTGPVALILAIGLANMPSFARMTASMAASLTLRDYVSSARLLGVPGRLLATRHLLPNMAEPLLILAAACFAVSLMEISALSFVGLGVTDPHYDFGKLLKDALPAIYTRPVQVVGPTIMIGVTALGAMMLGDGLAGAADKRNRGAGKRGPARLRRTGQSPPVDVAADSLVDVRGLSISDDAGTELVHRIDVHVKRGEILGLVGESGSGKSLTAMAIADLLPAGVSAEADRCLVAGLDLNQGAGRRALATRIGLVYQDPGTTFNPARRMGPQLTAVLRHHLGMDRRAARERILAQLTTVRISQPETRLRQHPHQLSGGMRQRAMIAAAMTAEPELLIADEPTTALDVTVQAEILRDLQRINEETGMTVLFISHDIGVVEALCDRVMVMRAGAIVEVLPAADLADGRVSHPYTRDLLDSTPRLHRSPADLDGVGS